MCNKLRLPTRSIEFRNANNLQTEHDVARYFLAKALNINSSINVEREIKNKLKTISATNKLELNTILSESWNRLEQDEYDIVQEYIAENNIMKTTYSHN